MIGPAPRKWNLWWRDKINPECFNSLSLSTQCSEWHFWIRQKSESESERVSDKPIDGEVDSSQSTHIWYSQEKWKWWWRCNPRILIQFSLHETLGKLTHFIRDVLPILPFIPECFSLSKLSERELPLCLLTLCRNGIIKYSDGPQETRQYWVNLEASGRYKVKVWHIQGHKMHMNVMKR